jgi:hypothetical protein
MKLCARSIKPLKEAARGCDGREPLEIEWEETAVWKVAGTVRQSTAEDVGR